MPEIDVLDEVFVAVPPEALAACFADPVRVRQYWPDLVLRVREDRGDKGLRWSVSGALSGSMEVWLEPVLDGTVLHYFLRAELPGSVRWRARRAAVESRRRRLAARSLVFDLKRRLEAGRAVGCPPAEVR